VLAWVARSVWAAESNSDAKCPTKINFQTGAVTCDSDDDCEGTCTEDSHKNMGTVTVWVWSITQSKWVVTTVTYSNGTVNITKCGCEDDYGHFFDYLCCDLVKVNGPQTQMGTTGDCSDCNQTDPCHPSSSLTAAVPKCGS
jgi:hypothetical protein